MKNQCKSQSKSLKQSEWCMTTDDPITKRVANVKIVSGGQTGEDRGALEAAIAMSAANAKDEALKRLRQFLGMSSALVLNVAGPRESMAPGIQARAKAFFEELLWEA